MLRRCLNSLALFALLLTPALAQEDPFALPGPWPGENWDFGITIKGGSSTTNTNAGDPTIASITTNGGGINDIAVATCNCTDTSAVATCAITGPAGITNLVNQTSGTGNRQTVYYWIGTSANVGTTATCTNPGANTGSTTSTVLVFRGVDPLNPTDATTTLSTNAASTNPDPASITTVHDSAAVIATCSAAVATTADAAQGDITNYATTTPGRQANAANDNMSSSTATTWRIVAAAGAENPAAWNAWATSAWACSTVALRPWR